MDFCRHRRDQRAIEWELEATDGETGEARRFRQLAFTEAQAWAHVARHLAPRTEVVVLGRRCCMAEHEGT